jgi:hypothetical protein
MAVSKGIQTTEFALTCVVNVAALVGSLSGLIPSNIAIYVIAAINAVYGILRTIVKVNDPTAVIPDLPVTPKV